MNISKFSLNMAANGDVAMDKKAAAVVQAA
jgi:hypothetical protein